MSNTSQTQPAVDLPTADANLADAITARKAAQATLDTARGNLHQALRDVGFPGMTHPRFMSPPPSSTAHTPYTAADFPGLVLAFQTASTAFATAQVAEAAAQGTFKAISASAQAGG